MAAAYGWYAVFGIIVALNLTAAALAIFVLKPMRARYLALDATVSVPKAEPVRIA